MKTPSPIYSRRQCENDQAILVARPHIRTTDRIYNAGFTLVEMLVVIAITATLAALSLGAFGSFRGKASAATCTSNLRQVGSGWVQYVTEMRGSLPPVADDNRIFYSWSGVPMGIAAVIEAGYLQAPSIRYTQSQKEREGYACPGLVPMNRYVGGGDQTTYAVDSRNGRVNPNTGLALYDSKAWDSQRSKRAQIVCSDGSAHSSHPNVMFLDGHVEVLSSEKLKKAFNPYWNFSELDSK